MTDSFTPFALIPKLGNSNNLNPQKHLFTLDGIGMNTAITASRAG